MEGQKRHREIWSHYLKARNRRTNTKKINKKRFKDWAEGALEGGIGE